MKTFPVAAAVCSILLGGCASTPSATAQPSQVPADYGQAIIKADAEAKAKQFFDANLKDPYSAHIEYPRDPYQKCFTDGAIAGGQTHCGYALAASVNAKNSYGGYTGSVPYVLLFQNGEIRMAISNYGMVGEQVVFRSL